MLLFGDRGSRDSGVAIILEIGSGVLIVDAKAFSLAATLSVTPETGRRAAWAELPALEGIRAVGFACGLALA